MGVPTISAFQGSLYADRYLEGVGLLVRALTVPALTSNAEKFLADGFKDVYSRKSRRVLDSMEDPVPKIARLILKTAKQA
jgi:predicted glycosyltransferase